MESSIQAYLNRQKRMLDAGNTLETLTERQQVLKKIKQGKLDTQSRMRFYYEDNNRKLRATVQALDLENKVAPPDSRVLALRGALDQPKNKKFQPEPKDITSSGVNPQIVEAMAGLKAHARTGITVTTQPTARTSEGSSFPVR